MFKSKPIARNLPTNDSKQANNIAVNSEKMVKHFDVQAPLPNKDAGFAKDLSSEINPQANLKLPNNNNSIPNTRETIVMQQQNFYYSDERKQLSIYNQTAKVIKVKIGSPATTSNYDFIVNAQKLVVFPPFNFDAIGIWQDTFTNSDINPVLFTYNDDNISPCVNAIT